MPVLPPNNDGVEVPEPGLDPLFPNMDVPPPTVAPPPNILLVGAVVVAVED